MHIGAELESERHVEQARRPKEVQTMGNGTVGKSVQNHLTEAATDPDLRDQNPRVNRLYSLLQDRMMRPQERWGEEVNILDDPTTSGLPLVLRHAKAVEKTLLEMPISIEQDDLIVGNATRDGVIVRIDMPAYATEEERVRAKAEGRSIETGLAHKTPYYYDVMEKGLAGVIACIDVKIEELEKRRHSKERDNKLALFRAMRIECNAVIGLAHRYANLAEKMRITEEEPGRREELTRIVDVCRRVPELPPRSFHEAVQSFWMIDYAFHCTRTGCSCGRLDQFLYPTLEKELDAGRTHLEQAQELVDCLWLRFNDRAQLNRDIFYHEDDDRESQSNGNQDPSGETKPARKAFQSRKLGVVTGKAAFEWEAGHRMRFLVAEDRVDAINHFGENMLISGVKPDGSDGTNPLTYLFLNAAEKFSLTSPVLTVRLHRESPSELVHRVAQVLKNGGGMPYINNDDVIVQAYVDLGIPIEDSRDYANSNCWETMIQGKSDQELIRGMNFPLFLELALNRGVSKVHGKLGVDTGDPQEFAGFSALLEAWKVQADHQIKHGIDYIGINVTNGTVETSDSPHGKYCHNPLLSALTLDCIQNENEVTKRGARYTLWHVMAEGVANAIDSMAVIKKLVYEEKSITMKQLLDVLDNDWKGDETLRQQVVAQVQKFGNDNGYADDVGQRMMDWFVERVHCHSAQWYPTVLFPCSVGTFSWIISLGKEVAATPDGRHSGEPIAANLSPAPGMDVSGPTAAINSYVKMRVKDLAAGAPIDLRLSRSGMEGDEGTQRLSGLIKGFVDLGGNMMTLTVTDVEELQRAIEEPEKYRHLRVRMGGWSAYFVMLSKQQQLLHIRRVEHGLA